MAPASKRASSASKTATANTAAKRKTYRHGNVAAEALAAAVNRVEAGGSAKLSLRQVAGDIGIAHRSLYNHFQDRDALLVAVGALGFGALADAVASTKSPKDYVKAYADFAVTRRHLYEVMMAQRNASMFADKALGTQVQRLIGLSLAMFGDEHASSDDNRRAVMRIWMLLHGGVSLHLNGALEPRSDEAFVAELLKIAGL
ncbi:TetR/AcrR family transcriptional regulator [Pyruvatibacter sp.]|nr:TetR/AcrR family transcriptional regulator [Alphaproteobacteria bacterium]